MPEHAFDTLIIGQGLAGSVLALHLLDAGQQVAVIDDGHRSAASRVAAGLINPLAGLRFNRAPNVLACLAYAEHWYAAQERRFGCRLLYRAPMLRLLRSAEQRRFLERALADPDNASLLGDELSPASCPPGLDAPFGAFVQHRTGFVDLPRLLDAVREHLRRAGQLLSREWHADDTRLTADGVDYDGIHAARVVFCDGARLRDNPWFGDLPLQPEHGEIIDVQLDHWRRSEIVNGAHWLVPFGDRYRFGATHAHGIETPSPTAAGRGELLQGLARLLPADGAQIVRHQAGVRPGTRDRQPLIGSHPVHPQLAVCNGFGARGTLTVPWHAERLSAHWLRGEPLPAAADIARFG